MCHPNGYTWYRLVNGGKECQVGITDIPEIWTEEPYPAYDYNEYRQNYVYGDFTDLNQIIGEVQTDGKSFELITPLGNGTVNSIGITDGAELDYSQCYDHPLYTYEAGHIH